MDSSDCSFFRTNSTNEFSSPDIRWTLQRTTHSLHLVEQVAIHVCVTSMHDVWMLVNTGVGGSSLVNRSTRHEVAMILQRPAFVTRFSCYSDNIHVLFIYFQFDIFRYSLPEIFYKLILSYSISVYIIIYIHFGIRFN